MKLDHQAEFVLSNRGWLADLPDGIRSELFARATMNRFRVALMIAFNSTVWGSRMRLP